MSWKTTLRSFAAAAAGALFAAGAHAGMLEISHLYVFGDSLSDGGNAGLRAQQYTGNPSIVFPPPPYYNGQISNGPVAVQYLWNLYNPANPQGFQPSLAGGTNYAILGATTGTQNYAAISANTPAALRPAYASYGAQWQLDTFAAQAPAFNPATSLFVVWLFPNDVFWNADTGTLPGVVNGSPGGANVIANGIANVATIVQTLAAMGAQHLLVPNMPDLGTTPEALGLPPQQAAFLSFISATYNANLAAMLTALDAALPAEIVQVDVASMLGRIEADPAAYGFTNTTEACVANLQNGRCTPANWDSWLFWDGVHPTTRTHQLLASYFAQAVPEPASGGLLLLAGAAWLLVRPRPARRLAPGRTSARPAPV